MRAMFFQMIQGEKYMVFMYIDREPVQMWQDTQLVTLGEGLRVFTVSFILSIFLYS